MNKMKTIILCLVFLFQSYAALAENLRFSIIPRYSSEDNLKVITLVAKYLSNKTGKKIEPVITRDYSEFERIILSGGLDMAIENPTLYTRVSSVHESIASAVDQAGGGMVRGLVIARKNGAINTVSDLKGRKICIVGRTSTAGFLSPKLRLMDLGLIAEKDYFLVESVENKQENVIFSVLAGDADAGFIKESAFHKADDFIPPGSLAIIDRGVWLPNDAFSVKRTLPPELKSALLDALVKLNEFDEIMVGLGIQSWRPSTDSAYDPVRKAIEQ